jgi:hypothetical protein
MMASPQDPGDDVSVFGLQIYSSVVCFWICPNWFGFWQIFELLKQKVDPKATEERERVVNERLQGQYEKAQKRLAEVVSFVSSCE